MSPGESVQTGIDALDRKLGGGFPLGTVTVLSASPASQSELLLYEFAAARQTTYLSTIRPADDVAGVLENRGVSAEQVETVRVDPEEPIDHAHAALSELDAGRILVVDPIDVLESGDEGRYREFLAELKGQIAETASVAIVRCLSDDPVPDRRRETLDVADIVLELATEVHGDSITNRLTVPKFRGGQSVEDVVKLDLTSDIEVDRTRNIL